jgi:MFS family permease
LLVGLVVLVASLTEGSANDWIALAMTEGHELPKWAGVLGFAAFLGAMTVARIVGVYALDRWGRVATLRVLFACAAAGSMAVVFGSAPLAFLGAAVWGIGASLGFPVGISAAADDPARAAARISTVSAIGYVAFLVGPPLLGFLGDRVGVLHSLLAVAVLIVPALLGAGAVRQLPRPAA